MTGTVVPADARASTPLCRPARFGDRVALAVVAGAVLVGLLFTPFGPSRPLGGAARPLHGDGTVLTLAVRNASPTLLWRLTGGRFGLLTSHGDGQVDADTTAALDQAAAAAWGLASMPGPGSLEPAEVELHGAIVGSPAASLPNVAQLVHPGMPPGAQGRLRDPQLLGSVNLDVGPFRGGSLGLAAALAYLDELTDGHLTGGKVVAATGSVDVGGWVGPVRSIAVKARAAADAGAEVLFVPAPAADWFAQQDADALRPAEQARAAAPDLEVVEVRTLAAAVRWLCERGGTGPCSQAALAP